MCCTFNRSNEQRAPSHRPCVVASTLSQWQPSSSPGHDRVGAGARVVRIANGHGSTTWYLVRSGLPAQASTMQNGEAPSAELINRIEYSEKYMDDIYEYRCARATARGPSRELWAVWFGRRASTRRAPGARSRVSAATSSCQRTSGSSSSRTACSLRRSGAASACSRAAAGSTTRSTGAIRAALDRVAPRPRAAVGATLPCCWSHLAHAVTLIDCTTNSFAGRSRTSCSSGAPSAATPLRARRVAFPRARGRGGRASLRHRLITCHIGPCNATDTRSSRLSPSRRSTPPCERPRWSSTTANSGRRRAHSLAALAAPRPRVLGRRRRDGRLGDGTAR